MSPERKCEQGGLNVRERRQAANKGNHLAASGIPTKLQMQTIWKSGIKTVFAVQKKRFGLNRIFPAITTGEHRG